MPSIPAQPVKDPWARRLLIGLTWTLLRIVILIAPVAADQYVALRIDPDGQMWIFSPPGGSTSLVSLSGLSFHILS